MDNLIQDLRFAVRSLARSPGFAIVALLTVALGVGANTAMFSIVNGVLLRPPPYDRPEQLVRLYQASPAQGLGQTNISALDFEDWHARSGSFQRMAAYWRWQQTLTGRGEAAVVEAAWVTDEFFPLLGAPLLLGRPLLEEDFRRGERNAVISYAMWQTRFGGAGGVIGELLELNGAPFTVVGVAGSDFDYPSQETQVWVPHSLITEELIPRFRQVRYLEAIGRLREGVDAVQARQELSRIAAQLAAEHPASNEGWDAATIVPLRTALVGDVERSLLVLLGAVGFILLIGCVNLANLLLARGSARSQELAVRRALGASRPRLVRQLITESAVLAVAGGAVGLLLSVWGVHAMLALSAGTLPRVDAVRLDGRVIAFTFIISALAALLFGLVPALRSVRTAPGAELRGARGAGRGGQRLRSTLVVVEVMLAVVLVIGAGLMLRSFAALRAVDPGFDPDRVLTVSLNLAVPTGGTTEEIIGHLTARRDAIIDRVRALPGVVEVGSINALPLRGEGEPLDLTRAPDGAAAGPEVRTDLRYVNAGYFPAMGIPLLSGAGLSDEVAPGNRLPIVVSRSAARQFWPDAEAVGQVLRSSLLGDLVVTGVVGDVRQLGLADEPTVAAYLSQSFAPRASVTLVVRASRDPLALVGPIRAAVRELDPNQPLRTVATLQGVVHESVAQDRFLTMLFALFGGLGLGLAALGTYGVLAYSVGQRTREIGVRIALGARAGHVLGLVMTSGLLLVGAGLVLGTVSALAVTRVLQSRLYGISASDPATFVAALAALAAIGAVASYVPARRALRVEPAEALRSE